MEKLLNKKLLNDLFLFAYLFYIIILFSISSRIIYGQSPDAPPNILFIAVDDLKPVLGSYGDEKIKTPNIDRLAAEGTVFLNNYCQQAVCGPTRASLMTGKRPDYTKVWDLKTKMRDVNPDILTIPQYFAQKGYTTTGVGKIYDPRCVDNKFDKPSWTIPFVGTADESYYSKDYGKPVLYYYQSPETRAAAQKYIQEANQKGVYGQDAIKYALTFIKPSVESADVPDNAYQDGADALEAKDMLKNLANGTKPFFLAVGFRRPHLPFVAPKKYWDMYNRDDMPVAQFQEHSKNGPEIAYHNSGELRNYTDIPPLASFTDQSKHIGLPIDKQKELIHGYYAAVSYTDAQVGILLNTLDSLGLAQNTIIVLWGDHGWHLGDHDLWCKHTNFEQAAHSPLIISAPGFNANKTKSPTEFVDIFPTLCELAELENPDNLDGVSLVPIMENPETMLKQFAVSQYNRKQDGKQVEGYSIRTKRYRYTEWLSDFKTNYDYKESKIVARELYDYENDPLETVCLIGDKEYESAEKEMKKLLLVFFSSQDVATNINTNDKLPEQFYLKQNYPNPFNPATNISYQIPQSGSVSLKVYDTVGREIQSLVDENKNAGTYNICFNGSSLSSGIYIYKLESYGKQLSKKMVLLK